MSLSIDGLERYVGRPVAELANAVPAQVKLHQVQLDLDTLESLNQATAVVENGKVVAVFLGRLKEGTSK